MTIAVFGCGGGSTAPDHCGAFSACGGNIVGTWELSSYCAGAFATSTCEVGVGSVSFEGSVTTTFKTDGTYATTPPTSLAMSLTYSAGCFGDAGASLSCADIKENSATSSVTCTGDIASSCTCNIATTSPSDSAPTGTYSVSGTQVISKGDNQSNSSTMDYCVQGDTLSIATNSSPTSTTPARLIGTYHRK